eukprot:8353173-Alexandrium_andersonii.AAC.1
MPSPRPWTPPPPPPAPIPDSHRGPSDEIIHRMLDEERELRRAIDQLQNELALSRASAAAAPPDAGGGPPAEAGG